MKKFFNNVLMDTLIAFYSLVLVGSVILLPKFVNELTQDDESVCDAEWSTNEHPDSENTIKNSDAFFSNTSNVGAKTDNDNEGY